MLSRSRGRARVSSRRIPSTIRKMDKPSKSRTPPRIPSRTRSNPSRRSRSPRPPPKKPTLPRSPIKRRGISLSPKRNSSRKSREDSRLPPKRPRDSSKSRKNPPEKKYSDKPIYEGTSKELPYLKENLKEIKREVLRDFQGETTQVRRTTFHPQVTIPRRPVGNRGDRDYGEMENNRYTTRSATMSSLSFRHVPGRGRDVQGEGSTPIFDRQEIIENKRKYDEYDLGPSQSDRIPQYEPSSRYNDNYRGRDYYTDKDKDRNMNDSRRSPRDYEYKSRGDRSRDDVRYQQSVSTGRNRSFDRSGDYQPERKDRYDDRDVHRGPRRSLERDRGRSEREMLRRHQSPVESRKHIDQYREYDDRRARSLERREVDSSHFRNHHDYSSGDRFSNADHSSRSRGYHEVDGRENPSPSRGRGGGGGGGSGFYQRGRGGTSPGRPFARNMGLGVRPYPPDRTLRGMHFPQARLPFHPRFFRPVIHVITPLRPRLFPML